MHIKIFTYEITVCLDFFINASAKPKTCGRKKNKSVQQMFGSC